MNVAEIREIAKTLGIKGTSKLKKTELIHAIQSHEGNADCYAAPWRLECGQDDCLWRRDCQGPTP